MLAYNKSRHNKRLKNDSKAISMCPKELGIHPISYNLEENLINANSGCCNEYKPHALAKLYLSNTYIHAHAHAHPHAHVHEYGLRSLYYFLYF